MSDVAFTKLDAPKRLVYRAHDRDGRYLGTVERRKDGTYRAEALYPRGRSYRSDHSTRAAAGRALLAEATR